MKEYMIKLNKDKTELAKSIEYYDSIIVSLNKESEQFNYILQENKKAELKKTQKLEELVASEYMQAKYIQKRKDSNDY